METNEKMVNFMEKLKEIGSRANDNFSVEFEVKKKNMSEKEEDINNTLKIEIKSNCLNQPIASISIKLIPFNETIDEQFLNKHHWEEEIIRIGRAVKRKYGNCSIAYLEQIWVDDNYQNNGIESLLMENIFFLISKGANINEGEIMIKPAPSIEELLEKGVLPLPKDIALYK